jgi:hypothetical protein
MALPPARASRNPASLVSVGRASFSEVVMVSPPGLPRTPWSLCQQTTWREQWLTTKTIDEYIYPPATLDEEGLGRWM